MPSTYSTNLRFELMATGEKSGTWGTISNTNIGTLIEQAISGVASVTHDNSANYSLTTGNGTSDESRNAVVVVTGTLTAARNLVVPSVDKLYVIKNSTSGGYNITVKTSGGTGVVVENGNTKVVFCDATNVEEAITEVDLNKLTANLLEVDNLQLDGNTISSTDTNGNILLQPNGTGSTVVNESGAASDFRVEGDTATHMLFVDASADRVGINKSSPANTLHVDGSVRIDRADNGAQLTIVSTDTDASAGPEFVLDRDSASPADNDRIADVIFKGRNSSGSTIDYITFDAFIKDVTAGSEDSEIDFRTYVAGSEATRMIMKPDETVFNEASIDLDLRAESNNETHMLFVDAGNDQVIVGGSVNLGARFNVETDTGNVLAHFRGSNDSQNHRIRINTSGASCSSGLAISNATGNTQSSFYHGTSNNSLHLMVGQTAGSEPTSGTEAVSFSTSSTTFNESGSSGLDFRVESDATTHQLFVDADLNQTRVNSSSRLFGTANPQMEILGSSTSRGGLGIKMASATSISYPGVGIWTRSDGSGATAYPMVFYDGPGGSEEGSISVTSSGTTFNTSSDRRLKTDINPIADATEKLMAMNPVTHKWIADPDADAVNGFIAQEMQEIVPEAVTGEDGGKSMMAMDYGRITPILVAALQESNKKIEQLEARIAELEAK